jgi:hypothetical protein
VRMQCSSQLPLGHMRTPVIRTRRSPTRRPAQRRPETTTRQKPHLVAGPKRREQDRRPASTGGARAQPVPNRREWPGGRRHPTSQSRCLPADAKTTAKRERELKGGKGLPNAVSSQFFYLLFAPVVLPVFLKFPFGFRY